MEFLWIGKMHPLKHTIEDLVSMHANPKAPTPKNVDPLSIGGMVESFGI